MKKLSFWKIISFIFVCALLVGALAANVTAAETEGEEQPAVEIVSNNVFYGSTYQIMYAIAAPSEPTVTAVDSQGNEIKVIPFAETPVANVNGKTCYIYVTKSGVAAQAIDEVITVTATYGDETATQKYSVLQYVYERLNVKNIAQGAERTMFEALLAYADAANAFVDKATVSFTSYTYVEVVGGTVDGANTAGMFAPNATPFANIEADEFDTAAYKVEWLVSVDGAEAVRYSDDEIKTLAVSGAKMTVTADLVANECPHTQWNDATCTEPKTCVACGATDGEALGHAWADATCTVAKTCETCGATEGAALGHNIVVDAAKAPTCTETGLTEGSHCTRCDDETVEQNVVEASGHDWTNATCTTPKTCDACGLTEGNAGGHATPNSSGMCPNCGAQLVFTATMSYSGSTTNMSGGNDASKLNLDAELFTVIGNKGGTSNNCGLNQSGQIRLYGSKSNGNGSYFTVTIAEGYTIKSIKVTIGSSNGGLKVTAGGAVLANGDTSKNATLSYDINGSNFTLQNVVTGSTTQIYITGIEIVYEKTE